MALEMLHQLLDPARWSLELIAPGILTAELLDLVELAVQKSTVPVAGEPLD